MARPEQRQRQTDYRHLAMMNRGSDVPEEPKTGYVSRLKHIKSPNTWSCIPAAFAMVSDFELDEIINEIGHDGSEVVFSNGEHKGFCLAEVFIAMHTLGFFCLEHPNLYEYVEGEEVHRVELNLGIPDTPCVMLGQVKSTGKLHAWAWDGTKCLDPTGFVYDLDYYDLHSIVYIINI